MGNEGLYLRATNEIDDNRQDPAIWAKALALTDGDHERARYKYIKLRVEQLETSNVSVTGNAKTTKNSESVEPSRNDIPRLSKDVEVERTQTVHNRGFIWWQVQGWLGLTLGNVSVFVYLAGNPGLALLFASINTVLMLLVIVFNKYAFLVATILSLNPLLWIINGIYLKKRWNHPQVNSAIRNSAVDQNEKSALDVMSQPQPLRSNIKGANWICLCGHANPFRRDMDIQNCVVCHRNRDFVLQGLAKETL